jgi:hypothetical protein
MTDTFACPTASPLQAGSAAPTTAGSKLYQTWVASAAEAAMVERRRARRAAEREYRLMTAAAFPLFLTVAVGARALPPAWRRRICGGEHPSVVADARAMVAATIPLAFMA